MLPHHPTIHRPAPARAWHLYSLLSPGRDARELRALYYRHFGDRRRERQLFSTGAFFATFAAVRAITHAIRAERGPFRNITPGGRHIHHMTFGITGLLTVGYLWMLEIGVSEERRSSRVTAAVYGAGAALTLDEFALWLNLADDYWTARAARASTRSRCSARCWCSASSVVASSGTCCTRARRGLSICVDRPPPVTVSARAQRVERRTWAQSPRQHSQWEALDGCTDCSSTDTCDIWRTGVRCACPLACPCGRHRPLADRLLRRGCLRTRRRSTLVRTLTAAPAARG